MENGYQIQASIFSYGPSEGQHFGHDSIRPTETLTDPRLHVCVFYRDTLVREVTTTSIKGCRICPCSPEEKPFLPPGGPELVPLPVRCLSPLRSEECPPSPPASLDQGLLLWMASDGLYAQRLCQSRVYWLGGQSSYGDKPNKLEQDVPCRLLNTQDYLSELQSYGLHGRPLPRFQVLLSFGDECLDPQRQRGSLTVQVEPLLSRQLLYYAQQTSGHYYRGYEHAGITEHIPLPEDYHRPLTLHHSSSSSSVQE